MNKKVIDNKKIIKKIMIGIILIFFTKNLLMAEDYLVPKKIITADMTQEQIFNIGDECFMEGNYEEALEIFKRNLENKKFIFGAATTSRLLGRHNEAIGYYDLLISKNPEFEEGYFGRALSYRVIEEYNKAINDLKQVLKINNSEYVYVGLGDLYILQKEKAKAKLILDEGVKHFPDSDILKKLRSKAYN